MPCTDELDLHFIHYLVMLHVSYSCSTYEACFTFKLPFIWICKYCFSDTAPVIPIRLHPRRSETEGEWWRIVWLRTEILFQRRHKDTTTAGVCLPVQGYQGNYILIMSVSLWLLSVTWLVLNTAILVWCERRPSSSHNCDTIKEHFSQTWRLSQCICIDNFRIVRNDYLLQILLYNVAKPRI